MNITHVKNYDMIDEDGDFKYLVRLPMDSVTEENVERIIKEKERKISELETLKGTTEPQLWLNELDSLKKEYMTQLKNKELEKEMSAMGSSDAQAKTYIKLD